MPHYRITIKLEGKKVQEFIIEDERKQIDFVYLDYRKRVYDKNGAGRETYYVPSRLNNVVPVPCPASSLGHGVNL